MGHGNFVDDHRIDDVLHAAFLRSPLPHARIVGIDISRAQAAAGVAAVFTGREMKRMTNPFLPVAMQDGLYTPLFWPLANDRVRFVGDPVVLVVAESRHLAEEAVDLIEVEYEALHPIANTTQARSARDPIWPRADANVLLDKTFQYGDVDQAFARADRVISETFSSHRQANQPMETRGCVVEITPSGPIFHCSHQNSHALKWVLAMSTSAAPVWRSLRSLAAGRKQVAAFVRGLRSFAKENRSELKKRDNSGLLSQIKREPRTPIWIAKVLANVVTADRSTLPRVVGADVGGSFGLKTSVSREEVAVCGAARALGRSIKWIEDRYENLAASGSAREESTTMSVAVNDDGRLLAFRVHMTMDAGAYPAAPASAAAIIGSMRVMMPGTYRLEAYEHRSEIIATNKSSYVAYRGPWANETWVRERMLDVVARELGMSATDLRLKNMYCPEELPTPMITGPTLDTRMSARRTLERAIAEADLERFESDRSAARADGRCLGVGFATYHEGAPGPPDFLDAVMPGGGLLANETVRAELRQDGSVDIFTAQMPSGQSHETTFAQVAADELSVSLSQVRVVWGDTDRTPFSAAGTGGSRGGAMGGGATMLASRNLRSKILEEAAAIMEATVEDLSISDGHISVVGVPAISISFERVAQERTARGDPILEAFARYDGGPGGWVQATHVAFVDICLETGTVAIPRYLVVEDCGEIIHPAVVEGQIRGGVAQGVGAVFFEKLQYDDQANFQSATYMDYLIPTAVEIPDIEIIHLQTPADIEANYRGVGEGGLIGSPAALTNAVEDALAHLGVRITEQHLPPTRILELAGVIPHQTV